MTMSRALKLVNKATSDRLSGLVSNDYELPSGVCRVRVQHSNDVKKAQRTAIWDIFEANMHELYENSSLGWNPEAKHKELFHSLARFILVFDRENKMVAFTAFRFDNEEEEDIIYLYDIQVTTTAQGNGLGKKMIGDLVKLCEEYNMEKIMLTVLKKNSRAAALYKSLGFTVDPSSPNYNNEDAEIYDEGEEVDYDILSKTIDDKS